MKNLLKPSFFPAVVWAGILAFLMLLPQDAFPESKLLSYDKLAHVGVFAILSAFLGFGFSKTSYQRFSKIKRAILALTISIVYGFTLEFLQQFVPGRMTDAYDLLANFTGAVSGIILFYIFMEKKLAIPKLIL